MKYLLIDRNLLSGMHEILSLSAGYNVSLPDELEYFESLYSSSWILAVDEQKKYIGFARSFQQNADWSLAEIFVAAEIAGREKVAMDLLLKFQGAFSFGVKHRLRIDVLNSDIVLNNAIEQLGLSHSKQTFLYFQRDLRKPIDIFKRKKIDVAAAEIAYVFSNLHETSADEVTNWLNNNTVRTIVDSNRVVAAAQISNTNDAIEIIRIATHPDFLRLGYAKKLIEDVCSEAFCNKKLHVYLKVEDVREPAISLYKICGFKELLNKKQVWHSSWY